MAVLFSRDALAAAVTLTIWENQQAADALKGSTSYGETARKLEDSGLLKGTPTEESLVVEGGYLPGGVDHKFRAGYKTNVSYPAGAGAMP